jgi:hypothetical protein
MSVQSDRWWEARFQHLLKSLCLGALLVLVLGAPASWAQDAEITDEAVAAVADSELWSRVIERYSVVVLSRGLLLEPLDDRVEMQTIEIIDDSVAIDGEVVGEDELRVSIGSDDADLVLQLAAMDRAERRRMFEGDHQEAAMVAVDSGADATQADEVDLESAARDKRRHRDSQVSVGNSLTVEADEVANEALVFGGPLYVYGKVAGDAVAVGGSVTVSGEVTGDVAAVGGDLTLEAGAEVLGDVVSVGGAVDIDDEAKVRGQIIEVPFGPNLKFGAWPAAIFGGRHRWGGDHDLVDLSPWSVASNFMWEAFKLIVLGLFACLVMLVARDPLQRVKRKAVAEPWKSGLVGLLVQILFAPLLVLVTLILIISIIGIPLVLLVPFFILALLLVAFLGYSGVALAIGEFLRSRFGWKLSNPYSVLLLGVLTIQIWSVIGDLLDFGWGPLWFFAVMFGVVGVLVKYVAWTVGLGAAVLSRFGTSDSWSRSAPASYPQAPAPGSAGVDEPSSAFELPLANEPRFSEEAPRELPDEPGADPSFDPSSPPGTDK